MTHRVLQTTLRVQIHFVGTDILFKIHQSNQTLFIPMFPSLETLTERGWYSVPPDLDMHTNTLMSTTGFVQHCDCCFRTFPGQNYVFFRTFQGIALEITTLGHYIIYV